MQEIIRFTIFKGWKTSLDPRFFALRKEIVEFAHKLAQQMHKYCDSITCELGPKERGAIYGEYHGEYESTENWHALMSLPVQASYIAAYLLDSDNFINMTASEWDMLRGKVPKHYTTPVLMADELHSCKDALNLIGTCFSLLFTSLADDDNNPLRNKDQLKRNQFRNWAVNRLKNLISLTNLANQAIEEHLKKELSEQDLELLNYEGRLNCTLYFFDKLSPEDAARITAEINTEGYPIVSKNIIEEDHQNVLAMN